MTTAPRPLAPAATAAPQVTTLTLLRLPVRTQAFGFKEVAFPSLALASEEEGAFLRLMGTGRGRGFSFWPDLGCYVLFGVFEGEEAARAFHRRSPWLRSYRGRASEVYTLALAPVATHGAWDGRTPFRAEPGLAAYEGPVVAVTRATLRLRALPAFWRAVPAVDAQLAASEAVLSVGFGEWPWIRQATFSLWPSSAAMLAFAYAPGPHRDVMRRARAEGWFSEALFARFRPLWSEGSWSGGDPLAALRDAA